MRLRHRLKVPALLLVGTGLAVADASEAPVPPAATAPPPVLFATPPPATVPPPQASIPFASMQGSIRDWQADEDKGVWIQANGKRWYYATFFSPCRSLQFENAVGFMPGSSGTLDRWGALYTPSTGKCQFTSLVASSGPPPKPRKKAGPSQAPGPAH